MNRTHLKIDSTLPFENAPSRNRSTRLAMKPHTGKSLSEVNYVTNNITKMQCWTYLFAIKIKYPLQHVVWTRERDPPNIIE